MESFKECNFQMSRYDINDGTTAAVALLTKDKIYAANVGSLRRAARRRLSRSYHAPLVTLSREGWTPPPFFSPLPSFPVQRALQSALSPQI